MAEIGSVIQARVVAVEHYGVFLKHKEEDVFIPLPELSWSPLKNPQDRIGVGDMLDVYVLRYNYQKKELVGSVRRLHPETNPYRQLAGLKPGTILSGKVIGAYGDGVTVQVPNGAWGHIPKNRLTTTLELGESIEVVIVALEPEEGILSLEPISREFKANGLPGVGMPAGKPG